MSAIKTISTLYNPGEKDKQALINEFVIRLKEFENIFGDIKTSKMKTPEQHYLLVGQRGSGKSTLIQRLRYAIEDDEQLSKWLIPIAFTEEQYNITELGHLWERVAEHLEDYHNIPGIVAEMEKHLHREDTEPKQLEVLLTYLRKHKKKLVLFIDNLGDMLNKFKEIEVKRLREVLQTVPDIRLIAASPLMLDSLLDPSKALFEFFKIIRLAGLNKEEIETLLLRLGEENKTKEAIDKIIKEAPERIEILRRLTGGVVRTVVMMYNVFIENAEGNPIGDLNQILDDATPLYKHKMDDLPTQQQKIVDAVARNWEAVTTGELTEKLRLDSKIISSQLRQLEKDQWIEKIETNTKNHLYQIKERFFNIWYLMRYGRRFDKGRVIWFVKFMESWLEKGELEQRMKNLIKKIYSGKIEKNTVMFWTEVYAECINVSPFIKYTLLQSIEGLIPKENTELSKFSKRIKHAEYDIFCYPERLNHDEIEAMFKPAIENKPNEELEILMINRFLELIYGEKKMATTIQGENWITILNNLSKNDKTGFCEYIVLQFISSKKTNQKEAEVLIDALLNKGNLYFIIDSILFPSRMSKEDLLSMIENFVSDKYKSHFNYQLLNSLYYLWSDKTKDAIEIFNKLFEKAKEQNKLDLVSKGFTEFLLLNFLAKHQFQFLFNFFSNESYNAKEIAPPIYYALMHHMKDEYPNEYLRMPPEMKETVEDVIKKVEEYKIRYA